MSTPPDPTDRDFNEEPPEKVTATDGDGADAGLALTRDISRRTVSAALTVLLVVALLTCGWFGWKATEDEQPSASAQTSADRDAATRAATEGLVAFHTIDYRHISETLSSWGDVSTGKLHAMANKGRKAVKRNLTKSRTVSTGKVDRLGVTSFDEEAGEARVVALVSITSQKKGMEKKTSVREFLCLVERGNDGWKMSAMQNLGGAS